MRDFHQDQHQSPMRDLHQPPMRTLHQDQHHLPMRTLHQDQHHLPMRDLHQDQPPMRDLHQDQPPMRDLHQDQPPMRDLHQDQPPMRDLHQDQPPMRDLHQDQHPVRDLYQQDQTSKSMDPNKQVQVLMSYPHLQQAYPVRDPHHPVRDPHHPVRDPHPVKQHPVREPPQQVRSPPLDEEQLSLSDSADEVPMEAPPAALGAGEPPMEAPPAESSSVQPPNKKPAGVKRPMNAFMVWSSGERKKVSAMYPKMHNSEISRRLGEVWRGLGEEDRRPYREEARRLRVQHAQDYPGYKYTPRKRRKDKGGAKQSQGPPKPKAAPAAPPLADSREPQYPGYQDPYGYVSYPPPPKMESLHSPGVDVSPLYGYSLYDYGERRGFHPQVHYQTLEVERGGSLIDL